MLFLVSHLVHLTLNISTVHYRALCLLHVHYYYTYVTRSVVYELNSEVLVPSVV